MVKELIPILDFGFAIRIEKASPDSDRCILIGSS
jgi:hypothetical protein